MIVQGIKTDVGLSAFVDRRSSALQRGSEGALLLATGRSDQNTVQCSVEPEWRVPALKPGSSSKGS